MAEKTTVLSPSSPQFSRLEYSLQLALQATTARIVDACVVVNPHLTVQFEKKSKGLLCLESWLDVSALGWGSTEEDVIKRLNVPGFGMPSQGMKFPVGQILLDQVGSPAAATPSGSAVKEKGLLLMKKQQQAQQQASFAQGTKRTVKMLLCKVAVGRSFVSSEKDAAKEEIPAGYDSFYLSRDAETLEYYHEYWIKQAAQVLPQYLVTFEYDPIAEKNSRETPSCDNCENAKAVTFCSADNANLCGDCDANLHMANKVAQRHIRTPIGKGSDVFGQCRAHAGQKIEFFCSQCHLPVCVHCKMVGHHSTGEAAKHKLVAVTEAFDAVLKESQRTDTVLMNRKTAITRQTDSIHQRAKQVEQLQNQLEQELEQMYQTALHQLRDRIQQKQLVLLSDELELKRQQQEIQALDAFLEYQRGGVDTCPLLFNWSKHQQIRQELHEFQHFKNEIDVQLDLKVDGAVQIVVDAMAAKRPFMSPPKFQPSTASHGGATPAPATPARPATTMTYHTSASDTHIGGFGAANSRNASLGMGLPSSMNHQLKKKVNVARRTSEFFAETLNALDDLHHERASALNTLDADEYSVSTAASQFRTMKH